MEIFKEKHFFYLCDAHGSINIALRKHFENYISFSNNKGTKMPEMMCEICPVINEEIF